MAERFTTPSVQGEMYDDLDKEQKEIVDDYNKKIENGIYKTVEAVCICGQREHTKITEIDRYGFWHPVALCEACGLMYANPRPVWEVLEEFYKSGDYRKVYGGEESEEEKYDEHLNNAKLIIMEVTELIKIRELKTVFEFGCGGGWNLILFERLGMEVTGCDFDSTLIELGRKRGLDLQLGSFELLENKKYDVIILSHVVEHFDNFFRDMKKIREAMSKNGILYIALPNAAAFGCNALQNVHNYYFKRSHLDFFMKFLEFKKLNYGYTFECQDFFAIYDMSDDISMKLLGSDKEFFKKFLKRIGILK